MGANHLGLILANHLGLTRDANAQPDELHDTSRGTRCGIGHIDRDHQVPSGAAADVP